jgi:hypothetical protein
MAIDTRKVTARRQVHYNSLDEILADAERMSRDDVRALGNWSAGQIFSHLASGMRISLDGSSLVVPWYFRLMGRLMKKRILQGPMSPGFQLPAAAAREFVPGPKSTAEGLAELREVISRLQRDPQRVPSPFLGPLTREEWDQMHCTHAALHMSFLVAPE